MNLNDKNSIQYRDGRALADKRAVEYYYSYAVSVQPYDNSEYLRQSKILMDLKNKYKK